MQLRKKLHDAIVDGDEDDSPRRKIKKLDTQTELTLKVFNNDHLLHHIIENVNGSAEKSILDFLYLRLVSKTFNQVVLSRVRLEYRQVLVCPRSELDEIDGEEAEVDQTDDTETEDQCFLLNERKIRLSQTPNFFKFLNSVARIRIRDILFGGFLHPEPRIHACIVEDLLADNWYYINSYKGSDEICTGCEMCVLIAARARIYGPFQYDALLHRVPGKQHFEHLIITEILLAEIAYTCVQEVCEKAEAFERLHSIITDEITCDQLDLVFSDRVMWANASLAHPREVIDCIVRTWRIKSINIRFMTSYSSIKYECWASKGIFTEMRFDEHFVTELRPPPESFQRVEVDMQAGDEIATCFAESMGMFEKGGLSATAFQNVCANVKRVFPTQDMYLILPTELARVASVEFDGFCKALLEFAWKDERTARHSRLYFRLYTFGITEQEVMKQVEKTFAINRRPVAAVLSNPSVRHSFLKWLPGTTNSFDRSLLSFSDTSNNCVLHLEVCIEPE